MKTLRGKLEKKVWNFYFPFQKHLNVSGTLLLSIILFTSCLDPELETLVDYEESFAGITAIEVEAGSLPVEYVGSPDEEDVYLDALLRSNVNGGKNISYQVIEDKLYVSFDQNGLGRGRSEGHIRLSGPIQMSLQLQAGSGEVFAENVVGDRIHLEVNSGRVGARNLEATEVYLAASSGEVLAANIKGNTIADLSSGKLTLRQVDGNLDATSSSGNMEFQGVKGLLNAELSSGNIDMEQVEALGRVTLSSGKATGRDIGLSEHTFLKASSGNISIQTNSNISAFNYEIHAGSGRVKVGESESSGTLKIMNGSAHTIKGEVSSGKIEIVN
ncbi:DUF4097 family beta strand repeat-containing protein [Cyclobacterium sp.]|uniref:DUF4097 family beta strand repeat-containing protein n=1 Tax=Cyclobacterium sp. TaxID=1966343 RepID=UPI0019929A05|nr:DUF4097 family beta strand repeat-containing protein [Cyclobacterium sp.]MBD3629664.1 DUF4097 family beta strand repeat protein [Cyclobacterium sp.]